jgi:hypothetical protein
VEVTIQAPAATSTRSPAGSRTLSITLCTRQAMTVSARGRTEKRASVRSVQ